MLGRRQCARAKFGSLNISPATHVETCGDSFEDRGFNSPRLHFFPRGRMRIVRNGPIRTRKQYLLVVGVAVLLRDYEAAPTQKEKPMATPISIFNPNNLPIDIIVNNGSSQLQVLAAAGPNWTPPTPTTNPTFNYGPPAPGNLGIGSNLIQIMPQGSTSPFVIAINLPGTVNWSSIQIYISSRPTPVARGLS